MDRLEGPRTFAAQSPERERDSLHGMPEIAKYSGFSATVIKRLALEEYFPLGFIGNRWISSRLLIDEWFQTRIREHVNKYLPDKSQHPASILEHPAKRIKTMR